MSCIHTELNAACHSYAWPAGNLFKIFYFRFLPALQWQKKPQGAYYIWPSWFGTEHNPFRTSVPCGSEWLKVGRLESVEFQFPNAYLQSPEPQQLDGEHGGACQPRLPWLVVEPIKPPAHMALMHTVQCSCIQCNAHAYIAMLMHTARLHML